MADKEKFLQNNTFVFANRIFSKIVTFLLMLYIARLLEPSKFGELSLLITLASIFNTLQDLGTSQIIVRQIASKKFDSYKTLITILVIKTLAGSIFFMAFFFAINILNYSTFAGDLSYIFAAGFICESFLLSLIKYFEGKEIMQLSSAFVVAERLLISIIILVVSSYFDLIKSYAIAYLVSNSLVLILGLVYVSKNNKQSNGIDFKLGRELLIISYPFIIYNIFSIIYFKLDIFLISKYLNEIFVGTYRASYQLIDSLYFISLSLSISLLPFFSRKLYEDRDFLKKSYSFILKELIYLGIYLAIFISLNSQQLLKIFYNGKYLNGVSSFAILSITIPFFYGSNIIGNLLISIGREKTQISSMVISTILKIVMLIFLIREFGIIGAAMSCLIAEMVSFLIQFIGAKTEGYTIVFVKKDIANILLIAVVAILGLVLKDALWHSLILAIIFIYHSKNNLKLLFATIKKV